MAIDILAALKANGIGDEMLDSARNYILGQFPTRLETAAQLAAQFATLESYGLDLSHVDAYAEQLAAVDGERLRDTVDQVYPGVDDLVMVLLGDAELIRDQVAKYGPVIEIPITEPRFRLR